MESSWVWLQYRYTLSRPGKLLPAHRAYTYKPDLLTMYNRLSYITSVYMNGRPMYQLLQFIYTNYFFYNFCYHSSHLYLTMTSTCCCYRNTTVQTQQYSLLSMNLALLWIKLSSSAGLLVDLPPPGLLLITQNAKHWLVIKS